MRPLQDSQSTPTTPGHIKFLFEKKPGVPITFWQGLFFGFLGMVTYKMFKSQGEGEEQNSLVSVNAIIFYFACLVAPLFLRVKYDRLQINTNTIFTDSFKNCNEFDKDTVCAAIEKYFYSNADIKDYNSNIAKYLNVTNSNSVVSDISNTNTKDDLLNLFEQCKEDQEKNKVSCWRRLCG